MDTLRLSFWHLLIEAVTLTSVAGAIALAGSMLLARSLTSLMSYARVRREIPPIPASKPPRCVDELFVSNLKTPSRFK